MNIQSAANQGLLCKTTSQIIPQHPQFDFEQWASAVRKQMQPVVQKQLILPSTDKKACRKQSN